MDVENTSSEQVATSQDYRRIIYTGSMLGGIFLIIFAFIDSVLLLLYLDASVEALGGTILLLIAYAEKRAPIKSWAIVAGILVVVLVIGTGIFVNHSADGAIIWFSIFPFLCFFILGEKLGLKVSIFICSGFIFSLTVAFIFFPEKGFNLHGIITASGALSCSILLAFFYEKNRTKMIQLLAQQAKTDPLTSLLNRRGFIASFNLFMSLSERSHQSLCLLILDLDHFKSVNDNFGHDVGDTVIIECAKTIKSLLRNVDSLARLGGEEYIALLPNTSLPEAKKLAQRIRASIAALAIETANSKDIKITASIGITTISEDKNSFEDLYKVADEALYEAKNNGRNCVVIKE